MARTSKPAAKPKPAPKKKKPPQSKAKQAKPAPSVPTSDDDAFLLPIKGIGEETYTRAKADKILMLFASGKSMRSICRLEGMPSPSTVTRWAVDNVDGFGERYDRARPLGLEAMADEIRDIGDEPVKDMVEVQNKKLRSENLKWLLARLAPNKYGDKVSLDVSNKIEQVNDKQLNIKLGMQLKSLPPEAMAAILGRREVIDLNGKSIEEEAHLIRLPRLGAR